METVVEQMLADHQEYRVVLEPVTFRVLGMSDLTLALLGKTIKEVRLNDYRQILRDRFGVAYETEVEKLSLSNPVIRATRIFPGTSLWLDIVYRAIIGPKNDIWCLLLVGRDVSETIEAHHKIIELMIRLLTRRELEVVELIFSGMTRKEIAHALGISVNTYDNHVAAINHKFGIRTPSEARDMIDRIRSLWNTFKMLL